MDKKKVYALAKWLANPNVTKEKLLGDSGLWPQILDAVGASHHKTIAAILDLLGNRGEMLGLNSDELVAVAQKLDNKYISREVFNKLSPNDQERHPELAETVGASTGPGTSFTSTASVARYPVPIGAMRRAWWQPKRDRKKKKRK